MSGQTRQAVRFDRDGAYEIRLPPGENAVTLYLPKPWKLVDYPMGLDKTFSLADGQDVRLDLWVIQQREP
jgi:hypothetical protein